MKPKRLPRLWCALQGLLPLESCRAAQRAELAWPRELAANGLPRATTRPTQGRRSRSGDRKART
jgi:hypothetical protein